MNLLDKQKRRLKMERLTHKIVNDNEHKLMKFTKYPEFKLKIEFFDGHTEIYIHCINYYLNDISGIYYITYWDGWKYVYIQINRELIKEIKGENK